ncbi:hypothetical protein QLX08_001704 [Tetragonisca angustula]|uniref:Nucleolar 27S pre-rRNA processing Urb2/Npa2 C-terminal domain-containing protein n=1 Tax=Tetragonisca angustula TaxID=166442 RepID=A0AAW1AGM0_9HYME
MSLSVELLKRLNTDEEPLPKRLKLAENAFSAIDVPIIHKNELILQWLCNICSIDQKGWNSLKNCLNIKCLNIKTDVIKRLLKVLIETFQQNVNCTHEDVFECCSLLTSNDKIQEYFINNPEDLGLLTKSLLEYVNNISKYVLNIEEKLIEGIKISLINRSNKLILTAYNTIITVIENIIQIYKSAFVTKDSLRIIFICDILNPLCVLIDHNCTDSTNRLGAITHKCIQQLIFGRKHSQNGEFLKDEDIAQYKNLLSILTENAKTKDFQSNLMTFTFFFRVAITTFKSDTVILDIILRELVECSGTYKVEILNAFLKCLNDVTFNFDNKVYNVTLFDYCQNIIDDILISKSISDTDYDLLIQFCYFNPLIIERRVKDILRRIFIEKSALKYKHLMISILDAFIHLREEEKLISAILITLKDTLSCISPTENNMCFSSEFKEKLMKTITNITNSQSVVMLRTLTYHLRTDCLEILQPNNISTNILILQATVELLITLLDGICIFEYSETSTSCKKFINAFNDIRNILSLLLIKTLCLNHAGPVMILLTAIFSWNETQRALKYYMSNTVLEDLVLSISENQWKQLIKKIKKFGNEDCKNIMNKLILQQMKMPHTTLNESFFIFDNLIGGLENCWSLILKSDTEIILSLSNEQVLKLTHLLLTDITSTADNFNEWVKILQKNDLQENKRFIIFILTCIFIQIGYLTTESVTKSMSKYFNAELLFETEIVECDKINDILTSLKEELLANKWTQIQNAVLCKIKVYLEVLLHLPLMFLNTNLKIITLMYIFAIRMECNQSSEIVPLCNIIFSDLLERSNIDVFQYIDPFLLLQLLPQNKTFKKLLELFLKNCSYKSLKRLIKSFSNYNKNIFSLLESMERIKSKLDVDQKIIIKKAEKRLIKIVTKALSFKITNLDEIKILNLLLRIGIKNESIDEKLKVITESAIQDIFMNNENNKITNELLQDGLQLIVVILHNKKVFHITNQTTKTIWNILFKYPCIDVLSPLLASSELKEFSDFTKELHNRLVKALLNAGESDLENICFIWNAILKTNMSNDRNKLRLTAINNLIQTIQTVNVLEKFWPNLLKLIYNILVTKHLYLPGYIIDMSLILSLKSLQENTIVICSDTLALCNVLLKMRTNLINDRMSLLLTLYRQVSKIFVHKSKYIINKSEEHTFKCVALDIEKFTSSLIKLKKDMIRLSPYVIADLLKLFSESSIPNFVKVSMQHCINQLISVCDQHGIALLSRILPVSMQEIFKIQLDTYNKFYKFIGKI